VKTATRFYYGRGAGAYVAEEYWYRDAAGAVHGFDSLIARGSALPAIPRPTTGARREIFLHFEDQADAVPAIVLRKGRRLRIIHGLPLRALRNVEQHIAPQMALLPDSLSVLLERTLDDPRLRNAFDDCNPVLAADDRLEQILTRLRFRGHPLRTSDARHADITVAAVTMHGDYARLVLDLPRQGRRFTADYLRDRQAWKLTGGALKDRRRRRENGASM
jgi:hypothetical protein